MNMNQITLAFVLSASLAFGQQALTQTTSTAAMTATQTFMNVTSATGITKGTALYIYDPGQQVGELVQVKSNYTTGTYLPITRGSGGPNFQRAHVSAAIVVIAPTPSAFMTRNPYGACTAASTQYTPWVNTDTGQQWLCSTVTLSWVPGWNNTMAPSAATTAVASVAGATLPSGPLFHVTGTNAITGWTLPLGFNGGSFTAIFDGAATWTAAGNIALASLEAMTAGCAVTFTYEKNAAKFYASTLTCAPTP